MAVQIRWQDGSHQWIRGDLAQGQHPYDDSRGFKRYADGFSVVTKTETGRHYADFGSDTSVISLCPDAQITDWSKRANP